MTEPQYQRPDIGLVGPEHVRRYRETGGEVGHIWNGVPILLLTTVARTASPEDKPRLWNIMTKVWPNYDVYQSRTDRDIPLVVLTPTK